MPKTYKKKFSEPEVPVDFVIITALEEERDAPLSKFKDYQKLDKLPNDVHTYYYANLKSLRNDGSIYQVILTCLLNMGPIHGTALAVSVVHRWKPRFVILGGIACGIKGEVNLGDVMIATQIADYTLGKQTNGTRQIRWDVFPSGPSLLDSSNNIGLNWAKKIGHERPGEGNVEKIKGVIASGGDVISDDDIIESYSKSWPKLVGIEMESGGVAAGVHQTTDRPEFIMIKSVSDFGKDKHDPQVVPWRRYACETAATFIWALIRSGPAESTLLISKKNQKSDSDKGQKEAAERRWQHITNQPIKGFEILLLLKSKVGREWLTNQLASTSIFFPGTQTQSSWVLFCQVLRNRILKKKAGRLMTAILLFGKFMMMSQAIGLKKLPLKSKFFRPLPGLDAKFLGVFFG